MGSKSKRRGQQCSQSLPTAAGVPGKGSLSAQQGFILYIDREKQSKGKKETFLPNTCRISYSQFAEQAVASVGVGEVNKDWVSQVEC